MVFGLASGVIMRCDKRAPGGEWAESDPWEWSAGIPTRSASEGIDVQPAGAEHGPNKPENRTPKPEHRKLVRPAGPKRGPD